MSEIARLLDRYLEVRRALGYKLLAEGRMLRQFTACLEENGHDHITTVAALAWATAPRDGAACWHASRLSAVRAFARFAAGYDPRTEIPPARLLAGAGVHRLIPRIFTEEEIGTLVTAAGALANPLRAASIATLIGLMAATGMRSGEVMGLDRADVDLPARLLTVHHAKFGKHRLVPVHPSTATHLDGYRQRRDLLCPRPATDAFLVSSYGTRLNHVSVSKAMTKVTLAAGIGPGPGGAPLRLYDLRHTFAVTTQMGRIASGASFRKLCQHALPAPQRSALPCAERPGTRGDAGDLRFHERSGSGATMMRQVPLRCEHRRRVRRRFDAFDGTWPGWTHQRQVPGAAARRRRPWAGAGAGPSAVGRRAAWPGGPSFLLRPLTGCGT